MSDDRESGNRPEGAASLRETTKWLVGGVVITAAGVFAGSSLTNLGSLDPQENGLRLGIALGGAVIGFVALGLIMSKAIGVLTVDSLTIRMIAAAERDPTADPSLKTVAGQIWQKFRPSSPLEANSLSEFCNLLDALPADDPRHRNVQEFTDYLIPDAGFLYVRDRFRGLVRMLIPATALAVVGFGMFAWAANPPPTVPQNNAGIALP